MDRNTGTAQHGHSSEDFRVGHHGVLGSSIHLSSSPLALVSPVPKRIFTGNYRKIQEAQ